MTEPNNILSIDDGSRKGNLSEEKLMAYLEGKLSPADQHEVEQWLANEGMESDAVEGLRTIQADETRYSVKKLNTNLRKTILGKKHRRRSLHTDQFTWIAIAIILLLIVLAYIVIRKSIP